MRDLRCDDCRPTLNNCSQVFTCGHFFCPYTYNFFVLIVFRFLFLSHSDGLLTCFEVLVWVGCFRPSVVFKIGKFGMFYVVVGSHISPSAQALDIFWKIILDFF